MVFINKREYIETEKNIFPRAWLHLKLYRVITKRQEPIRIEKNLNLIADDQRVVQGLNSV